ncbi:hypothetical protein C2S53_006160 [Perilla frutescens var. hirtella]|uniref:Uncharacterized protein n=1 Tax=Perilla frutescens var. hirtella TaxID=608512 RepID=A0AAD4IU46_PERFH|nr:hypothetical protein C2S51_008127 [Perilla frutescens var. frutescens]KAH6821329.1 hypothetical protein C2S53_006160 [Perilla frutescens var. hirtella]
MASGSSSEDPSFRLMSSIMRIGKSEERMHNGHWRLDRDEYMQGTILLGGELKAAVERVTSRDEITLIREHMDALDIILQHDRKWAGTVKVEAQTEAEKEELRAAVRKLKARLRAANLQIV